MSTLLSVAVVGGLVATILALGRAAGGPRRRRTRPRADRRSWLVAAWNASGARPVESPRLGGATAELAGRAAGGAGRAVKRLGARSGRGVGRAAPKVGRAVARPLGRAGRAAEKTAARRWEARAGRPRGLMWRHKPKPPPETEPARRADPPDPPEKTPPPPPPDRPRLRAVPDPPQGATPVTTPPNTDTDPAPAPPAAVPMPPDWAVLVDRVTNLDPGSDDELIRFMGGELAGVLSYSNALLSLHDTCVSRIGLDPSAVAGIAEYAEAQGEAARKMSGAHRRFLAVYREVMQAVAAGVQLPFRGRFFTRDAG